MQLFGQSEIPANPGYFHLAYLSASPAEDILTNTPWFLFLVAVWVVLMVKTLWRK